MTKIILSIDKMDDSFKKMKEKLSKYCEIEVTNLEDFSLKDCDIFIGKKLKAEKLNEADKLKCIFAYKTGVDDFPLKELEKKNIKLVNSHVNCKEIAQYAFALASSLVFHVNKYDCDLRKKIWYDENDLYWESIFNLKIGLLGYGKIGKSIHEILLKNDINTYTLNRGNNYKNIKLVNSLDELIKVSDVIICSLPKTNETNDLFDSETFKKMEGKYIVNVGRSNIIDEQALFEALSDKRLKGAAIDTWKKKPKDKKSLLSVSEYDFASLDNIILSPHAAMRTKDGHDKYVKDITNKIIKYLTTSKLSDVVDYKKGY